MRDTLLKISFGAGIVLTAAALFILGVIGNAMLHWDNAIDQEKTGGLIWINIFMILGGLALMGIALAKDLPPTDEEKIKDRKAEYIG